MQSIKCEYPPGLVGVMSGDLSRFTDFTCSMIQLAVPSGSSWFWVRGNGFARNANLIVQHMLDYAEHKLQWVFIMGDDHVFEQDIIMRLLAHNVDIVQPLVSTRKPPFFPYAFKWAQEKGMFDVLDWDELPRQGLFRVDGTSSAGMLVKRKVVETIKAPWFEEGKFISDALGEDLWFAKKAMEAGFRSYLDLDTLMGHITTAGVWPTMQDDKWCIDLDMLHGLRIRVDSKIGRNIIKEQ